jgi:hypothetical protein
MKKIILSALFAICALGTQAQQKITFGVKAGLNAATLTGDGVDGSDVKAGVHVGVVVEFRFNKNWGFQPELLFSMQGAQNDFYYGVDFNDNADFRNEKLNLDYLNLPLVAKYHFNRIKGLSVELGPQIGFLLSAKYKNNNNFDDDEAHSADVKDLYKSTDIGLTAGAEYEFRFKLFVSVRGNLGLSNISDVDGFTIHNNVIQLSAGYRFF